MSARAPRATVNKDQSPFFPGRPVAPDLFMGRGEQLRLVDRALRQARGGGQQYLFVTGERGIGKSSLASFGMELAEKEHDFVAAHAMLGGANDLGEACRRLYQALVSQLPEKKLIERVRGLFERYIAGVDLFGHGVQFKEDPATRQAMAESFVPLLVETVEILRQGGRSGVFLVADDLNGIARNADFAHFLKSTDRKSTRLNSSHYS